MSVTVILSALVSIAKAIPKIQSIIDQFYHLWIDYKVSQARSQLNYQQKKERALYEAIKNSTNDSDRVALSIILHDMQSSSK